MEHNVTQTSSTALSPADKTSLLFCHCLGIILRTTESTPQSVS